MTRRRRRKLRCGFTTGTAAAAATKAALMLIFSGRRPQKVKVGLLTGDTLEIACLSAGEPQHGCVFGDQRRGGRSRHHPRG